jgi:NAD-dependent deacetylase
VYPAAGLPLAALAAGKPLVEINPVPTPLSESVSFQLMQPSGIALPALLRALA